MIRSPGELWTRRRLMAGFCLALAFTVTVKAVRAVGAAAGGLVEVLPNLGFSLALTFLFARWTSPRVAALVALAAGTLNELSQLQARPWFVFAGRTFDPWDLVASVVGAAIGYGVVRRIRNREAAPVQGAA